MNDFTYIKTILAKEIEVMSGAYTALVNKKQIKLITGLLLVLLSIAGNKSYATVYYNNSTGQLNSPGSWGTNTDGSGTAAGSFTNAGDVFNLNNAPATQTFTTAWVLGATSGSGLGGVTLNIHTNFILAANNSGIIINGTASVPGALVIASGDSLIMNTGTVNTITLSAPNATITDNGAIETGCTKTTPIPAVFYAGAVIYNGTGLQKPTVAAGTIYTILVIDNNCSTTTPFTFISGTSLELESGTLTATASNIIMNAGSHLLIDQGALSAAPTFANFNPADITYTNLGQNFSGTLNTGAKEWPAAYAGNVIINYPGVYFTLPASVKTPYNLTVTAGTLDAANTSVTLSGGNFLNSGSTIFTSANLTTNNFTNTGTFSITSGDINVSGNWTNNGTFTAGTGTVTFNSSTAQTIAGTLSGTSAFYDLTFNGSGSWSFTANPDISVTDNFTIAAGTVVSTSDTLTINNNYSNSGTFTNNSGTVLFTSTSSGNTISGTLSGASAFYNLIFDGSGTWSFPSANNVMVANNCTLVAGTVDPTIDTFTIAGNLINNATLKETTGILVLGGNFVNNGTFKASTGIVNTAGNFTNNGTFTEGTGTVGFDGSGAQTISGTITFYNLAIDNSAGLYGAPGAGVTVSGTMLFTAGNYVIGAGNTLTISGSASGMGPTTAFTGGTTSNLTISGPAGSFTMFMDQTTVGTTNGVGTLTLSHASGTVTLGVSDPMYIAANITFSNAGVFADGGNNINVEGSWINDHTTGFASTGTVIFDGTGPQTLGGSDATTFNNLTNNNTTGLLSVTHNTFITGTMNVNAATTLNPSPAVVFNNLSPQGTITGTGTIYATIPGAFVSQYRFATYNLNNLTTNYNSSVPQTVNNPSAYGTLLMNNSGIKTALGNIIVNNALNVAAGTTLSMATYTLSSGGLTTYTVNGTLRTAVADTTSTNPLPTGVTWNGTGTVEYYDTLGGQTIVAGVYNNLQLDDTTGSDTAGGAITVYGLLTLGNLTIGTNNLTLAATASISGASATNYIVASSSGEVIQQLNTNGVLTYPIGDAANYTPIVLGVAGSSYSSANVGVNVSASEPLQNANTTNYINRYWSVSPSGINGLSYTATATFAASDVVGNASDISMASYSNSLPWTLYGVENSDVLTSGAVTEPGTTIFTGLNNVAGPFAVSTASTTICTGSNTTLSGSASTGDATLTYVWAPNTGLTATTGISVTASPTVTTTYTLTVTDGNGFTNATTTTVSVDVAPNAGSITGTVQVCMGAATDLTDITSGGVWSSSNGSASVGSESGVVTGVSAGTSTISYEVTSICGNAYATAVVTVNTASAGTINGVSNVNMGANITLTDPADGGAGSWSASNGNAIVSGGIVTGETAGTVTISYTTTNSCGTTYATKVITVNTAIPPIGGNEGLCAGGTSTLTDAATGGVWSMASDYASIVGSTGVVTASAALTGTATVTYTVGAATATAVITVNANPAAVQAVTSECPGTTITLTDATTGGTWSGSGDATVSGTGTSGTFVAGSTAGTATVTYTILATGCNSPIFTNTIYSNPQPIGGMFIMCTGVTTLLTDATMSGTGGWSSSNTAVATVSGFYVTGHTAGTAIITYVVSPGNCSTTQEITVNAQPAGITGNTSPACPGASFTLADGTGVWSSSNTAVATIGSANGVVSGVAGGTSAITYLASGIPGCIAQTVVTIAAAPAAISGPGTVCSNGTITLSDLTNSGTWSSGNMAVATIGSANGVVSGVSGGTTAITYTTNIGGCQTATTVTVTTAPTAIGGTQRVCAGSVTTLTDATGGGVWSSSNSAVATIGSGGSPVTVTGVGAGIATMTYTSGGCYVTAPVTVNALPGAINGAASVCTGTTTSLSDGTTGGLWSSSNTGAATIGSTTGVVTAGASAGTTTVSYTITSTGCSIAAVITVTTITGPITGNMPVCIGSNITLADGGGTWSSSNTTVAIIGSGTGMVTGVAAGTSKISYVSGGCSATTIVTVNPVVGTIKGTASVCQNTTTSLSDATTGGTWSSSNTAIATVGSTGLVAGVVTTVTIPATVSITYTAAGVGACNTTSVTVTVNPIPGSINGNLSLCASGTSTLTDATTPGTWSMVSSYASVAGSTGVVTASATLTGTAAISYTSGGCSVSNVVTVSANPTAVQAPTGECAGTTVTITDATAGGSWSGAGGNALVSGTGTSGTLVAGSTGGTETITYTIIATGCKSAVFTNTIYSNPAPITGTTFNLCTGVTVLLSDATMSGTGGWYSSNTAVATISGFHVTGQSAGTSVISYVVTPGNCSITQIVSVDVTPVVSAISGPASISESHPPVTLSDATGGGNWTSSNPSLIELISGTSIPTVTAEALGSTGSAVISYTVVNGWCSTTVTKTVGATTAAHPGGGTTTGNPTLVYAGSAVSLGGDAGGIWSSSDNGIATVDGSGLVTGITVGNVNITHVTRDDGAVTTSVTPVVVAAVPASISLLPNPNKGTFVVRGTVGSVADEEVTLEVTDVLGQVIYKSKVIAEGGRLNETIMLGNALANGMYMLNVQSGTENKTLHFVIAD